MKSEILLMGLGLCLTGLGLVPRIAHASETCPITLLCLPGNYLHLTRPQGESDPCSTIKTCRANTMPPDAAHLQCTRFYNTIDCVVWPQGPGFTYQFSTSGSVVASIEGSTPFPYQSFTCPTPDASGWAHIWVTSPSGTTSYTWTLVSCSAGSIDL